MKGKEKKKGGIMLVLSAASSKSSHRLEECYDYPERFDLGGVWCAREN